MIASVDLYLDRNTALHRLDPRVKLLGPAAAFGLTVVFNHPAYVAAVAGGGLARRARGCAWRPSVVAHLRPWFRFAAFVRNDLV